MIFAYILVYPESENCWTSMFKDIATESPSPINKWIPNDIDVNVAVVFKYWAIGGLAFNVLMIACYAHAIRVPCMREDLTGIGQIRKVRRIVYFTIVMMILFISTTMAIRWDHYIMVCTGDLIPEELYDTDEDYKIGIPEWYLENTGIFMEVYVYAFTSVFLLVMGCGLLFAIFITVKETSFEGNNNVRLA